jgi:RNA polymerase sigma-70 factor (ECF subfamily)
MALPSDLSTQADDVLVRAAQGGSLEAFEELVARHRDKVYARAYMMVHNEDLALDLAQDAWIKAWQRLASFAGESSFATWLTRITINVVLDHLRRTKRFRVQELPEDDEDGAAFERLLPAVEPKRAEGLERAELRRQIEAAMAQLTPEHRTVLVLHEFEGMQYKEIARTVGISIGTVMSRLFYARRRLAGLLGRWHRQEYES